MVRGGAFDKKQPQGAVWPPIDDYEAPLRQVKIPANPAVPPPFPVQLKPDGPIEFIGFNGSRVVAMQPPGAAPAGPGAFAPVFGPQKPLSGVGYNPGQIPQYITPYPRNFTSGQTPFPLPPFTLPPPGPYRQLNENGSLGNNNLTDLYDEDDPSVYYPPPYSFYYPIDDSKFANAGPLVPGIILPPPPDFFSPLEEDSVTRNDSTTHRPTEAPRTEIPQTVDIPNTYLPIPIPAPVPVSIHQPNKIQKPHPHPYKNNVQVLTEVTKSHDYYFYNPPNPKHVQINSPGDSKLKTTLRPVHEIGKLKPIYDYYEVNTVTPPDHTFKVYGPPPYQEPHPVVRPEFGRTFVSSTAVPLRSFYEIEEHEVPRPKIRTGPQQYYKNSNKPSASFFFYEEPSHEPHVPNGYYDKRYFNSQRGQQQYVYNTYGLSELPNRQPEQQYLYNSNPPTNARPVYYRVPKPVYNPQPSRQSFQQQIEEIQKTLRYYTTQSPRYIYRNVDEDSARYNQLLAKQAPTSKPVYQYSFNAVGFEDGQKSFRATNPQDPNNEPFRPMLSYNHVPLNPAATDTKSQYPEVTSETPVETKYVSRSKQQRYETVTPSTILKPQHNIRKPPINLNSISTTPNPRYNTANPLNSNYYTHQEEGLFDEITKKYFTIFGQKLYNNKGANELGVTEALRAGSVTTPLPPNDWLPSYSVQESRESYVEQKQKNLIPNSSIKNNFRNRPLANKAIQNQSSRHSLESDTYINYLRPRPEYNIESELVSNNGARKHQGYTVLRPKQLQQLVNSPQRESLPKSLVRDELVNYRNPRPPLNPDAEFIAPESTKRRPGVVSYDLPGDNAHVYFLTPQRRAGQFPNPQIKTADPIK